MSNTEQHAELGIALNVNAECSKFVELFQGLDKSGIFTIDPAKTHVTVLYPDEMPFKLSESGGEEAYDEVLWRTTNLLEEALEDGAILRPRHYEVERLGHKKRKVGLFIADSDWLFDLREDIKDTFHDVTKRSTKSLKRPFEPHITLGAFGGGQRKDKKKYTEHCVPQDIHVTGHQLTGSIWERERHSQSSPSKFDKRFNNRPRGDLTRFKKSA